LLRSTDTASWPWKDPPAADPDASCHTPPPPAGAHVQDVAKIGDIPPNYRTMIIIMITIIIIVIIIIIIMII